MDTLCKQQQKPEKVMQKKKSLNKSIGHQQQRFYTTECVWKLKGSKHTTPQNEKPRKKVSTRHSAWQRSIEKEKTWRCHEKMCMKRFFMNTLEHIQQYVCCVRLNKVIVVAVVQSCCVYLFGKISRFSYFFHSFFAFFDVFSFFYFSAFSTFGIW